jgi:hypothetical protein
MGRPLPTAGPRRQDAFLLRLPRDRKLLLLRVPEGRGRGRLVPLQQGLRRTRGRDGRRDAAHGFRLRGAPATPAWFRKQERQRAARDAVEETKKNVFRRRLFKYTILPYVDAIQGDEEREKELRRAWADFKRLLP